MNYKTILVHVNASRHNEKWIAVAAELAVKEEAHLVGVASGAASPSTYPAGMLSEGSGALYVYLDFLRERATTALAAFESVVKRSGVASYEKRTASEEPGEGINLHARYCDLVVLGQPDPDEALLGARQNVVEDIILHSGRPVLMLPYAGRIDHIGRRILVAWDASVEAMHAVTAAIPFLKRAELVQVAVFNPKTGPSDHGEQAGTDIGLYLARHGIKVEVAAQVTDPDLDIGNAILSQADDFDADLMVMGCYGHSRFREIVLGGATRTILASMTTPVLMAH